jgi:hypothetical protein
MLIHQLLLLTVSDPAQKTTSIDPVQDLTTEFYNSPTIKHSGKFLGT